MPFLTRYADDPSAPTVGAALKDSWRRAVLPGLVLWCVIVGIGALITGPLGGLPRELSINQSLEAGRTPAMDTITMFWSRIGDTEIIIGTCVITVALMLWRTRQWWFSAIPALAISLQATIFVVATTVADRERPAGVERLDPAPPTSSYPSGHVGASFALYLTLALIAQRIRNAALRRLVTVLCVVVPSLVFYARLYRGMHHLTDCIVGVINGTVCAILAWHYLRRRGDSDAGSGQAGQMRANLARANE